MARTFARASAASALPAAEFRHDASGRVYRVDMREGRLIQQRAPLDAPQRSFAADATYVIGSGNHARSYLHQYPNGVITQLPLTWYTQEARWAMSPGYDRAGHWDFSRQIEAGCLFCHNAYPKSGGRFGAVARFDGDLPQGIDCQRCHGSDDAHLRGGALGKIVNPKRLPAERQLDLCLQCHLETTSAKLPHAVRRFGRAAFSFQPGEAFSDYWIAFDHPPGAGLDDKFEINGAGYRMLQSACFLKSRGRLTCTTCHDPHRAAAATDHRKPCLACHTPAHNPGDCVSCHMPRRRAEDAVHVTMTDHKIQRPPANPASLLDARAEMSKPWRGSLVFYRPPAALAPAERDAYLGMALTMDGADRKRGLALLEKSARPATEALVELATAYLADRRTVEGVALLRRALTIDPAMSRVRYNLAVETSDAAQFERVLREEPAFAEALNSYGALLIRRGQTDAARTYLERAWKAQPYLPEPSNNLGLLAQRAGQFDQARAYFEQALSADPDFAEGYNNLARLDAGRGDLALAAASLERAVALNPGYAEAQFNLGRVLQALGQTPRALEHLTKAVTLRPNMAEAHMALGVAFGEAGRYAEAIAAFERVLAIAPGNQEARRNLALARELAAKR